MKRYIGLWFLLGITTAAQASQLVAYITADQIRNAIVTGAAGTFGGIGTGNCTSAAQCGIYAIDFKSASGVGTGSASTTTGTTYGSPATPNWGSVTILSDPNKGYEQLGSGRERLITANTHISAANNYTANATGASLSGYSAVTGTDQFAFLLDFGSLAIAPTSIDTLRFNVLGVQLNTSTGAQVQKGLTGTITITNVSLVAAPEPSTIALLLTGFAGVGLGRARRLRT